MTKAIDRLLPTTMVGSYPRPLWFHQQLDGRDIMDVFKQEEFTQAYDDATGSVIRDQERAGLDIVTDGQMYFDNYGGGIGSFVWYWYERLPGFFHSKMEHPLAVAGAVSPSEAEALNEWGGTTTTAKVGRGPTRLAWIYKRAARQTPKPLKVSVGAGPCNLPMHAYFDEDSYYKDFKSLGEDLAPIFHAELDDLVRAGASIIQLEDLGAWLPVQTGDYSDSEWVVETINRTVDGIDAHIGWHFCMGNAYGGPSEMFAGVLDRILPPLFESNVDEFVLDFAFHGMRDVSALRHLPADKGVAAGVIDVRNLDVEKPETVAERIRAVLEVVPADRVTLTTDCGMKALPRVTALEKLRSLVRGAEIVRAELEGRPVADDEQLAAHGRS
jgi:5-methyltetrahydropteroyltriglutamate--homocysteine methyltransferase